MNAKAQAKLTEPATTKKVEFAYNPEKITLRQTQKLTEYTSARTPEEYLEAQGIPTITMDNLTIYGPHTKAACDQLLKWSRPVPGKTAAADQTPGPLTLAILEFSWGAPETGLTFEGHLEAVTVVYSRFAPITAAPLRATVSLTFHRVKRPAPAQNPTSGGPPGRRVHTLDSSECLAGVTMAAYGRPSAWRDAARANRIADPLRVRPGTEIYLPEFEELADDGSRS